MAEKIPTWIHSELSEAKRRIIRSDAALFAILLAGAIGCIALSHYLAERFGVIRLAVQITLYAALLATGYLLYRFRLVSYRYTLTDCELTVSEVVGNREKKLFAVPLEDILSVVPYREASGVFEGRTYVGKRENTVCVIYRKEGERRVLCLSGSEQLAEKIREQLHA